MISIVSFIDTVYPGIVSARVSRVIMLLQACIDTCKNSIEISISIVDLHLVNKKPSLRLLWVGCIVDARQLKPEDLTKEERSMPGVLSILMVCVDGGLPLGVLCYTKCHKRFEEQSTPLGFFLQGEDLPIDIILRF